MSSLRNSLFAKKYGGKLIYQTSDEHGPLQVVDEQNIRSLHFGSSPKQSSLDLRHPNRLCLEYSKHMMTALLFKPDPDNCLVLGLGGGSIPSFIVNCRPLNNFLRKLSSEIASSTPRVSNASIFFGSVFIIVLCK